MHIKLEFRILVLLVLAIGILFVGNTPDAEATFKLMVDDGTEIFTVQDNMAGDTSSIVGLISHVASFTSGVNITSTTASSKPLLPNTASSALVDMTAISINAGAGFVGTITLKLTDTDFNLIGGASVLPYAVSSSIGGTKQTNQSSVVYKSFIDFGNAEFGGIAGVPVTTHGPFTNAGAFGSDMSSTLMTGTDPFAMTQVVTVEFLSLGTPRIVSFDASLEVNPVPEPSTIILFGIGMLGVLGYGLSRKRRKKSSV
jgi:hypothetical protein